MEWMFITGLVLFIFCGALGGIVALFKIGTLRSELRELRAAVTSLESPAGVAAGSPQRHVAGEAGEQQEEPVQTEVEDATFESPEPAPAAPQPSVRSDPHPLLVALQKHWMIGLGGMCVALAGIFLVRYSIEQGLLGPTARFVAGLVTGGALHGAAEYLRRRTGASHPAFAALAGAGSITLYAALLAGMRLYDLVEPGTAFAGMALVAMVTMAMAYVHGPALAAFGILGAYLVPVLTSTGGGQMTIALVYALIVSASALLLLRYVYRPWLWWGFLVGAFGWWFISLDSSNADGFRVFYLAILAYLMLAVPNLDWLLRVRVELPEERYKPWALAGLEDSRERRFVAVFLAFAACGSFSVYVEADYAGAWVTGLPMLALAFFIARSREHLFWYPWVTLLGLLPAWFLPSWHLQDTGWELTLLDDQAARPFLGYLLVAGVLAAFLSGWNWTGARFRAASASLMALGPYLLLTLGYLLTSRLLESWYWGLGTALLSLAVMIVASRVRQGGSIDSIVVWLFVAGHYGLALSAAMVFNEASLTLAIAVQMISVAWVIRTFRLPVLDWLMKLVVGTVIVRLTFNPWLASYPEDIHWPLYSYGGAFLCALVAMRILEGYRDIARWCEGAALHLFVLTIFAELRYQFHDGAVFASEYTLVEACTYMSLFAALGLVYYRRSLVSQTLGRLYRWFSQGLALLALLNYLLIGARTLDAAPWVVGHVSDTPVFNLLLAAYGAPIVIGLAYAGFFMQRWLKAALAFTGFAVFIFVSIEVRHLWEGTVHLYIPPTSDAELYTYSVAWLVLAVATMLAGTWRLGRDCYRAGLALLAIVIGKLFLVDMADLEGLLRVASFMGLGLSLLGLSYVHQRLSDGQRSGDTPGA